jgi:hypothetical protein
MRLNIRKFFMEISPRWILVVFVDRLIVTGASTYVKEISRRLLGTFVDLSFIDITKVQVGVEVGSLNRIERSLTMDANPVKPPEVEPSIDDAPPGMPSSEPPLTQSVQSMPIPSPHTLAGAFEGLPRQGIVALVDGLLKRPANVAYEISHGKSMSSRLMTVVIACMLVTSLVVDSLFMFIVIIKQHVQGKSRSRRREELRKSGRRCGRRARSSA